MTVTVLVAVALGHPPEPKIEYVIVAEPAPTPVITPEDAFTVATPVLSEDHVPPAFPLLVNVVVDPAQTVCVPLNSPALAPATTVTAYVAVAFPQAPPLTVYVIVALPELTALTTPVAFTEAIALFEELHVPPEIPVVVRLDEPPGQIDEVPLIVPAVKGTSIKSTLRLLPPPPSMTRNSTVLVEHNLPDQITPRSAQHPSIW